jgi:hypothetical protein
MARGIEANGHLFGQFQEFAKLHQLVHVEVGVISSQFLLTVYRL